jgi:hypothetical protein
MVGPEWRYRRGLIEPDIRIELLRQRSIRVVAQELGIRPVDDANKPLPPYRDRQNGCNSLRSRLSRAS